MRVKRQLEALEDYFKRIAEHRARGSIYAVERLAQLSIQALLDLGAMIAAWTRVVSLKPTGRSRARRRMQNLNTTNI